MGLGTIKGLQDQAVLEVQGGLLLWVWWGEVHRTCFTRCLWESWSLLVTTKQPLML